MSLKTDIEALANQFADGVLHALRQASLEDLLEGRVSSAPKSAPSLATANPSARPAKKSKAGRGRRSAADIAQVEGLVVAKLREHAMGLRSEQLQKALRLSKQQIVGPISSALASKKIVKTGERRATTYFVR